VLDLAYPNIGYAPTRESNGHQPGKSGYRIASPMKGPRAAGWLNARVMIGAILMPGLMAGCATISPTSSPPRSPSVSTTLLPAESATPDVTLGDDSGPLPGVGDPVATGRGLTITVRQVLPWPAPPFLRDVTDLEQRCGSRPDDAFLALDLWVEASVDGASISFLNLLVGPPNGTVVADDPDPMRSRIEGWCVDGLNGPKLFDRAAMPVPEFPYLMVSDLRVGEVVDGFVLVAVNQKVLAAGHVQLWYVSAEGQTVIIRLRP
jgi:hypothetical protein